MVDLPTRPEEWDSKAKSERNSQWNSFKIAIASRIRSFFSRPTLTAIQPTQVIKASRFEWASHRTIKQ